MQTERMDGCSTQGERRGRGSRVESRSEGEGYIYISGVLSLVASRQRFRIGEERMNERK